MITIKIDSKDVYNFIQRHAKHIEDRLSRELCCTKNTLENIILERQVWIMFEHQNEICSSSISFFISSNNIDWCFLQHSITIRIDMINYLSTLQKI